ncbi:protein kinase domain-containing protein [Tengunoibacter tsumagoiensis]|uniref:non-specific serine/threonine protein kinase n=1 Tax=Tengunoibacter tsumagoiensis TaxID=2014871 RepID=A0A402AAD6_9CHLR|nr:protein kinase [Tengunoibacter tsumagoiensis]GCE16142.1 hypothetical protein KTT_60010 [Tengunoibacter tsumagoiensis]
MQGTMDWLVGRTFGAYHVDALLGQGSISVAYSAHSLEQKFQCMLTLFVLPEACGENARRRFMDRFISEASPLPGLSHSNIVPVYDFGEYAGFSYLVTPLGEGGSLSVLLKQQIFTPAQALAIIRQIAAGLEYAHQSGVVHGGLKPSAVLLGTDGGIQIAGFRLTRMLEMSGIGTLQQSSDHLFSVAGTLLTHPAYIAPEVVQGAPIDVKADIYALGCILFELLTGRPPFVHDDPIETLRQHVEESIPSVHTINPDVPAAFDLVLQRALERNPEQRLTSAIKLVNLFERTLSILEGAAQHQPWQPVMKRSDSQWLVEEISVAPYAFGTPSFATASLASLSVTPVNLPQKMSAHSISERTPLTTSIDPVDPETSGQQEQRFDPFDWWKTVKPSIAPSMQPLPVTKEPVLSGRRKFVQAASSIAAASLAGIGGFGLLHYLRQPSVQAQVTPIHQQKQAATVLKSISNNSAQAFTNPVDKAESLLVRLPNGAFYAYESACTHEGVAVQYDPQSQKLVCPRHHATFDPAHQATVVTGPASAPLKAVPIHVQADGSVVVG